MAPFRLRSLMAAAAVSVLALSACSTGPADGGAAATGGSSAPADAGAFPVTIEHAFGETTLTEKPERVATVSWVNADVSLALGVVPVGMPADTYGGNENQSTPWKDTKLEELGAAIGTEGAPAQYSETDGIRRRGDRHRVAVESDRAGIRTFGTRHDLDQGRFARTVLPDQGMNSSWCDNHVCVTNGPHSAVAFHDPGQVESGHRRHFVRHEDPFHR